MSPNERLKIAVWIVRNGRNLGLESIAKHLGVTKQIISDIIDDFEINWCTECGSWCFWGDIYNGTNQDVVDLDKALSVLPPLEPPKNLIMEYCENCGYETEHERDMDRWYCTQCDQLNDHIDENGDPA